MGTITEDIMENHEVSERDEIFALPSYTTEDGKKRYIDIRDESDGDLRQYVVFDEYGRQIEDYWYGDWWKKIFNDKTHTVTDIDCNAINGVITKIRRKMKKWEYIENYWDDSVTD